MLSPKFETVRRGALLSGLFVSTALVTAPAAALAQSAGGAAVEEVIVTGTRQQNRTVADSPAPVDVVGAVQIARIGKTNAFDALNSMLPSFEIPASGGDLSRLVRSARLRGLSPDETLVLIDGKRRHVSASINATVGPVGGSNPVDLDMIPVSLIGHVEVLRDGAAAQYGSDAIAGVINIITNKAPEGGQAYLQTGAYYLGDGFNLSTGGSYGLRLGSQGYLRFSGDYAYHDHSNRCGIDPREATFGLTANPCKTAGDPQTYLGNLGANGAFDLGPAELYGVGTFSHRIAEGYNGWRTPTRYASPWYRANYMGGFVPQQRINENDFGATVGVRSVAHSAWTWDLSATYGGDYIKLYNVHDLNPSLITNTGYLVNPIPERMHAGSFRDRELTLNLDVSREVETGVLASPLTVAFGAEYRHDRYEIIPGEFNSYTGSGASAFPGIAPSNATNAHRSNRAVYVDLAANIVEKWQVDVAARAEHYSDVGNTLTGKLTTRYDFSPRFAVRGTISNGFRAPTLAQEFQTQLNVGPTAASGQLPVDSAAAVALGAVPLVPEHARNYSVGVTFQPIAGLRVAVDAYQINITDQVVNSGRIGAAFATNPALYNQIADALRSAGFNIAPGVAQVFVQFYTNGLATRTRGLDITAEYHSPGPFDGAIDWTFSGNFNQVKLTHVATFANGNSQFTPDVLSEITEDAPDNKFILQANYHVGRLGIMLQETRWGRTAAIQADASRGPPFYYTNAIKPTFTTDLQISYQITEMVRGSIGATNLTDQYPTPRVFQTRNVDNATYYPINSPFGFDGGAYYVRLEAKF